MIIWGTYCTNKVVGTGEFYCSHCAAHRSFKRIRPKKWGHLYWIPLIPMQEFDHVIRCTACRSEFTVAALDYDPIRDEERFIKAMVDLVGGTMAWMGRLKAEEVSVSAVAGAVQRLLGASAPEDAIVAAMGCVGRDGVFAKAEQHGQSLSASGQELVLRAAIGTGTPSRDVWQAAADLGSALGMTPAHVAGVMAEFAAHGALAADRTV